MAETHELRLKINAAAAKRGGREFVAAIQAVKRAVRDLERDSAGAFTRLNKSMRSAAAASKMKITGVDKRTLRDLDSYARLQQRALRATKATQQSISSLVSQMRTAASAYASARSTVEAFNKSLLTTNTALARQVQLASQARSAVRQIRSAPTSTASPASARAGAAQTRAGTAGERSAERQIALQNRARRAIDDSRAAVEQLTTKLMKLGGFETINKLSSAFRQLEKELSGARVNTTQLDNAKTKFNASLKGARTSITTLNAKLQEEQRQLRAAAAAAKEQAKAFTALERATKSTASAQSHQARTSDQQQRLHLSAAAAMRRAETEAARLTQRLRAIGDTRGIRAVNQALIRFKSQVGSGVGSTMQLRTAMSGFAESTNKAKVALIQHDSAQQRSSKNARLLATQERAAATQARALEREMRSVAGASNAASRSFRNATGNLRGMENAFSATFQVGSAFRAMLGTITLGTFAREVFAAGDALDQFRVTMEVATGSMQEASAEMDFVDNLSRSFGTGLREARADYSKFAVAASIAGVSAAQTKDIFESVAMSLAVLGRGTEDQKLAFMALEQMMSKGTISSEELRRQLGERLPGAVSLMAEAVGVSVGELQKMLKAGELISADVLPKFATKLREVFGPGLEKAQKRAGINLGKLQVEFQKFLETVAQSGLMDALAAEFKELTNLMKSPDARDAAVALGQGLADAAEMAGAALKFIATNIEEIGRVAYAVFVGIAARQAFLVGESLVIMGQRALAAAASVRSFVAPTAAAEAATTAHTQAINFNTQALAGNVTAQTAQRNAMLASAGAYDVALSKAIRGTAAVEASGVAATRASGRFGRLATGLGVLSRVFGALAGPIGIAVTAFLLLPDLFGEISSDADKMADDIEEAVRRSGVAFENLGTTIAGTTSNIALAQILDDIETLDQAVMVFATQNQRELMGLAKAADVLRGSLTNLSFGNEGLKNFTDIASTGIDPTQLTGLSRQARETVSGIADELDAATRSGDGFLELYDRIAKAIVSTPSAKPLLKDIRTLVQEVAKAELASITAREKLVELYGTKNEQLGKQFSSLATEVVRTGEGLDELRKKVSGAIGDNPGARKLLNDIVALTEESLRFGDSASVLREKLLSLYDDSAKKILDLRTAQSKAEEKAGKLAKAFNEISSSVSNLGDMGGFFDDAVPASTIQSVQTLLDQFRSFEDVKVSAEQVSERLKGIGANFPQAWKAEEWNAALVEQFTNLEAGLQTYDNFSRILDEVAARFDDPRIDQWAEQVRESIRVASGAGVSFEEFRDQLMSLEWPNADAREFRDELIEAASKMTDAERAALAAALQLDRTAESLRSAGMAGHEGAAGVQAIADAFRELGTAQAEVDKISADARTKFREMVKSSSLTGVDKAVFDAFASGGTVGKVLEDVDEQIATAQAAVAKAQTELPGEFEAANAKLDKLLDERARIVREGEAAVRQTFANNKRNKGSNKKTDLEKDLERIREEAFETDTALGKLARASDTLMQALGAGMTTAAEAGAIMQSLALQTAENIAEEEDLGKMYLTTAEFLSLNNAERKALQQQRIIEQALTKEGIDLLSSENAELMENVRLKIQQAAAQEAAIAARNAINERVSGLQEENAALRHLIEGRTNSMEVAKLMAKAEAAGIDIHDARVAAMLREAEAAEKLNDALSRAAKDPLKDWLDSVPTWEEAGEQIEVNVVNKLSDAIAEFAKTGKFNFESLATSILDTATDLIADKAVKELYSLFGLAGEDGGEAGLLGGLFSKFFSSKGDPDTSGAGQQIQDSIIEAGTGAAASMQEGIAAGSEEGAGMFGGIFNDFLSGANNVLGGILKSIVSALSGGAGGGGGGGMGNVFGSLIGAVGGMFGGSLTGAFSAISGAGGQSIAASTGIADAMGAGLFTSGGGIALPFREGGLTSSPHAGAQAPINMPVSAFHNAPHFAQGTVNTSGIPAVLHDNEAVIPLSRGRKVPVELEADSRGSTVVNQNFNISTPDADSFRRSQTQIAADGGMAAQRAMKKNT